MTRPIHIRKRITVLVLCLVLCLVLGLLSGCAGTTASRPEDQLVIALGNEPEDGFDPCTGWGRYGSALFQSALMTFNQDLEVVCDMATGYTVSDDGLTWTVTVREDVYFSDGSQLTAQDVAFTYLTAKSSGSIVDLTVLASATAVDDTTVVFTLTQPQSTFLYTMAATAIVPQALYDETYAENPIGSGPFVLVQWDKGQQVILEPNPYYTGTQSVFSRITLLFMSEDAAYAAAQKGDVDVALTNYNLAGTAVDGMALHVFATVDNRGMTLPVEAPTGELSATGYPVGNAVTSDVAVRQALSYGMDRQQLVTDCLNGYAAPAYSNCDGLPWGTEDSLVDYDVAKAIALLEDSGWAMNPQSGIREKDGLEARFTLLYSAGDLTRQALALAVSNQAKTLGIAIDVEGVSWDEIDRRMFTDAVLMGWGSLDPIEGYYLYHSDYAGLDYYNPEGYTSDTADWYLQQAMTQSADYLAYFQALQWDGSAGVATQGDCPWVWLVNVSHLYFADETLVIPQQTIHPHDHGWPVLQNLNEWTWQT